MHRQTSSRKNSVQPLLVYSFATALCIGTLCNICVSANSSKSTSSEVRTSKKALDLVFEGAWAFVQMKDGSIWAVTPKVDGHIYPYVRALNEAALGEDSFSLKFKSDQVAKSVVDSKLKNSVPPNLSKFTVLQNKAYISFQLPKPSSIIVLHTDKQILQDKDPDKYKGYDKTKEKEYATTIAFRYLGDDFSKLDLLDQGGKHLTLELPQLGSEGVLFIGVQPDHPDEDHSHAKQAFQELVAMFPPLQLYVNFDPNETPAIIKRGFIPFHHSGVDCYAAMLYVDCSSAQCTVQPLE
jgi:hypothetical protein